ncbi:MAG: response regulator [bacterium]|nr:response regulator [bacterium]
MAACVEAVTSASYSLVAIYVPLYVLVVVAFSWPRLFYPLRASALLLALCIVGMSEFWTFGLSSMGYTFFLAFVTFSTALLGFRAGVVALILSLVFILTMGALYSTGAIPAVMPVQSPSAHARNWITPTAGFTMLSAGAISFLHMLLQGLEQSARTSQKYLKNLTREMAERDRAEQERSRLEDQLFHSQKMEAIGKLAGGIAHDFNNILSAMLGYTELALPETPEGSDARRSLGEVLQAGGRAKDLVHQILTFSRQTRHEPRPVRLQQLVREVMGLLRSSLPATVEFCQLVRDDTRLVLADPTQLHQVLVNLCTNAAHAMREKGGTLTVELEPYTASLEEAEAAADLRPGSYCMLAVSDTGEGMDAQTLDRIFDPFFTTKEKGEGTGLGLATVHGIVKSHDGVITVDSRVGHGTTFRVYLPVAETQGAEALETRRNVPRGNGEHVMLVEDELSVLEVGARLLEAQGYRVSSYRSPVEALDAFRADPHAFDVVVTDRTMPVMTGIHLARELRALGTNVPVILVSGMYTPSSAQEAQSAGIDYLLSKPVDPAEMGDALRRVLSSRGSSD